MSTKNNLQNALKNAFENYEEPLKEAQWQRLEGAIIPRKINWRFYPFMIAVLLISISSIATYYVTIHLVVTKPQAQLIHNPSTIENNGLVNSNDLPESSDSHILTKNSTKQKVSKDITSPPKGTSINYSNAEIKNSRKLTSSSKVKKQKAVEIQKEENLNPDNPDNSELLDIKNESKEDTFEEVEIVAKTTEVKSEKDTVKMNTKILVSETEEPKKYVARYVLSLSTGYSVMNVKVTDIENSQQLHKDSKMLFEQSNQKLKSTFVNFGFDFKIVPGLAMGINTGLQYLQINTPVHIKYKLNEVPFWDIGKSRIIGYLKTDSANTIELNSTVTNKTSFIIIPLKYYYTIPLNRKNEILVTAGCNFSTIINVKGESVSVNEGAIQSLNRKMYSNFNVGLIGGVQYSRNIKNAWWLGLETQIQTTKMKFNTGQGAINNNLSGYNIFLNLRYKI